MRILVTPTQCESQAVLRSLYGVLPDPDWKVPTWHAGDLLIIEPGAGPELIEAILPRIESLNPQEIWLFGWCGGLTPELRAGDLVLADATIIPENGADPQERILHPPPHSLLARVCELAEILDLRLIVGPILTSDEVLASVEQKQVGAASGAVAVEMEAGPLARWAIHRSVSFVHLRVVLDPLLSPLSLSSIPIDDHGHYSKLDLMLYTFSHPREWLMLWSLMLQASKARKVMTELIAALTSIGILLTPESISPKNK